MVGGMKKKTAKKRNKQDATLINVRAAKKRSDTQAHRLADVMFEIKSLWQLYHESQARIKKLEAWASDPAGASFDSCWK